jgi:flagellar biosynthesis protein FlhA
MIQINTLKDIMISLTALLILCVLFIPISKQFLDCLLIFNVSFAVIILLNSLFIEKPLDFSIFPSLLLITTLFRLALNISATRLILTKGDAGQMIHAMGYFVVQENYLIGIIIFFILIIVQFVVITNGAQRIAEVSARFSLDGLPQKQMGIDAELNMGLITPQDAQIKRNFIDKEANFYGAMDGASKFVKGDAIAGILITLINLIGGLFIGMYQQSLSLEVALHQYSLLTIGDGLITQIPALIIAIATGMMVTKSALSHRFSDTIIQQFTQFPQLFLWLSIGLLGTLFIPNTPKFALLGFCIICLGVFYRLHTKTFSQSTPPSDPHLDDMTPLTPIQIRYATSLQKKIVTSHQNIHATVNEWHRQLSNRFGFQLPFISAIEDASEQHDTYTLWIDELPIQSFPYTQDIGLTQQLHHHLSNYIPNQLCFLLTREALIEQLEHPSLKLLTDAVIPQLFSFNQIHTICIHLLQEKISLRPLKRILYYLMQLPEKTDVSNELIESIREMISSFICNPLIDAKHRLHVLLLDTETEQQLIHSLYENDIILSPTVFETFILQVNKLYQNVISQEKSPVLLVPRKLRKALFRLTHKVLPQLHVLGMNEIPMNIEVLTFGVIQLNKELAS